MTSIKPEQFENYIISLIGKYENKVLDKTIKEKVDKYGEEAKVVVKGYSKVGDQLYRTGDYRRGWRILHKRAKGIRQIKVSNKNKPTLVHLLEFGHNIAGTNRRTRAYPHVSPTELTYMKLLYEDLRRELK